MSSGKPNEEMPPELVDYLAGGRLIVASTVDEEGAPYTMVMNSAMAIDSRRVRFAVDHRAHSLVNIRRDGRMMLEVIGDGMIYGVRGTARVLVEKMQNSPTASAMVELTVEQVKRDLPPGVQVEGLRFNWAALAGYMGPIEEKMFEELRTFSERGKRASAAG